MWEVAGLDQQRLVTSPLTGPFGECNAARIYIYPGYPSARAEERLSAAVEPCDLQLLEMIRFELCLQTHAST